MAKLRWALVFLALGIGLPAILIVLRATEALELEDAYRHETVAERVFDEMERSLSDFLLREEARPTADYEEARLTASNDAVQPLPIRFADADEPFIVGWFVLPSSREVRAVAPEPVARARIQSALDTALVPERPNEDLDAAAKENLDGLAMDLAEAPAPGRTSAMSGARGDHEEGLAKIDAQSRKDPSTYEVLQNLNRAGSLRSERQSKARKKQDRRREAEADFRLAQSAPPSPSALDDTSLLEAVLEAEEVAPRDERKAAAGGPVVDPLVGRMTADGSLVLIRSVWRGERVERQGLVLDRSTLIDWIGRRVLGETGLADRASLEFAPYGSPKPEAQYRYVHRFAEPFDDLVARLTLEPLPPLGASRSIPALALLLAIALIAGLFAVDRMTRIVVEFAERRSNFVAAVSHELRTPLTAIRMYAEMLRDGLVPSEEKRHEYYATITDESERLSRLIENVLEFSRLEKDRHTLDLVVGGLPDTLRQATGKLTAHVERKGFRLTLDVPASLPRVQYDRDAITQIVFNLVDNALKYAGGAQLKNIDVSLSVESQHVDLHVRDFGPGIPSEHRDRIFEPFYRIGDELTRTTDGTGIGLALVRELATGMNGRVRAECPENGGLEIIVSLPREDAA